MSGNLAKWVSKGFSGLVQSMGPQKPGGGAGKARLAWDRRRRRESDALLLVNKVGAMAVVATEQGINDRVCICSALQYDGTGQA